MSNFIRHNKVNMADEPLKVEQHPLESSSEMDKLCVLPIRNIPQTPKLPCWGQAFLLKILSDGEFQVTESCSAKMPVEEAQKCNILFDEIFLKNLYRKSLNTCKGPCRSAVVLT